MAVGKLAILAERLGDLLTNLVDGKPSLVIEEMINVLIEWLEDLKVSKTTLYNFVTKKATSLLRAHFHAADRNSSGKTEEWFQWVICWREIDWNYMTSCIFIEGVVFHINMERSMIWSRKGKCIVVVVYTVRAKTTIIFGIIVPYGVASIKLRCPRIVKQSKKLAGKSLRKKESRLKLIFFSCPQLLSNMLWL